MKSVAVVDIPEGIDPDAALTAIRAALHSLQLTARLEQDPDELREEVAQLTAERDDLLKRLYEIIGLANDDDGPPEDEWALEDPAEAVKQMRKEYDRTIAATRAEVERLTRELADTAQRSETFESAAVKALEERDRLREELAAAERRAEGMREMLDLLNGFRRNPCEDKYWNRVCSKCGQNCERVEYTHGYDAVCEVCTWKMIAALSAPAPAAASSEPSAELARKIWDKAAEAFANGTGSWNNRAESAGRAALAAAKGEGR